MPIGEGFAIVGFAVLVLGVVLMYVSRRNGDDHEPSTLDVQNRKGDR